MRLKLALEWDVGPRLAGGGFGEVFAAETPDPSVGPAVVKLVRKAPGAQRELLFVDLGGVRNVVPIIDSGETDEHWALVMPRAEKSLRQHITMNAGPFDVGSSIAILQDIATALTDLDGRIVHRDLKPENILWLNGAWCLADFGISRYADATTAPDTQKLSLSPAYSAPERWRSERATGASDVYALGVIAHELLSGTRPFTATDGGDLREQHLHAEPPPLLLVPTSLRALIVECLFKSPGARPGPGKVLERLSVIGSAPISAGRSRLQQANAAEVSRQSETARRQSQGQSEAERRQALLRDALSALTLIGDELKATISEEAPSAQIVAERSGEWSVAIGGAQLKVLSATPTPADPWEGWQPPAFDLIAWSTIGIKLAANSHGYEGRSHALWYCDAREPGRFAWFEVAFMMTLRSSGSIAPFAMRPCQGSAKALWTGMAEYQPAWPFTPIASGDAGEFIDRWIGWLADAAEGRLQHPSRLPEREPGGSWRR